MFDNFIGHVPAVATIERCWAKLVAIFDSLSIKIKNKGGQKKVSFSPRAQSYIGFFVSVIHVFQNKNSQEEALKLILKIKLTVIEILIKCQKAINKQNKSCLQLTKKSVGQNVRQVVKLIGHLYFLVGQCPTVTVNQALNSVCSLTKYQQSPLVETGHC